MLYIFKGAKNEKAAPLGKGAQQIFDSMDIFVTFAYERREERGSSGKIAEGCGRKFFESEVEYLCRKAGG